MAVQALSFLATDPERLGRFLATSGLDPADLRTAAQEPGFLSGVLDYLADDDRAMIAFAQEAGISPERVAEARVLLSGQLERDIP